MAVNRFQAFSGSNTKQKIIIDVDTGVDDAQAIMMALTSLDTIDVLAITCVDGNTSLDQVCRNTLRVLKVCQQTEVYFNTAYPSVKVPVFRGADAALVKDTEDRHDGHHGSDGLGGVPDSELPDMSLLRQEHAVPAICRIAAQHKGEVTVVCLAPLTNIALALRLDPNLSNNLKNVVIMGGNITARGNVSATGEFNFYKDPESAFVVLENLKCPIRLLSLEPCLDSGIDWEWYDNVLCKVDTPLGVFHKLIDSHTTMRKRVIYKRNTYVSCDPLAMAAVIMPSCVLQTQEVYCTVELGGQLTRGQVVVDWSNRMNHKPNVELILKLNVEEVKKLYIKMLR